MIAAGVKELKKQADHYLREVKKGEKILITERETVIATITPVERAKEDSHLLSLVKRALLRGRAESPPAAEAL